MDTFGNGKSQSMPGNFDGGSRKPPASLPPVTAKRSSSNASCLLATKAAGSSPNSKNTSLNISTCSANPARKCRDENDGPSSRARKEKREQEKPCKQEKETYKRYCCPALQMPTKCDYDKFQCHPKKLACGQSVQPRQATRDCTFSPKCKDECKDQGREFCTTLREREDCSQSCSKERSRPCSERCIIVRFRSFGFETGSDTLTVSFFSFFFSRGQGSLTEGPKNYEYFGGGGIGETKVHI